MGKWGLFRRAQRSATAIAVGETRLLVINRDSLYHLMQQRPRIATTLFLNLARQLPQAILQTSEGGLDQVSKTQQEEAPPTSQPVQPATTGRDAWLKLVRIRSGAGPAHSQGDFPEVVFSHKIELVLQKVGETEIAEYRRMHCFHQSGERQSTEKEHHDRGGILARQAGSGRIRCSMDSLRQLCTPQIVVARSQPSIFQSHLAGWEPVPQ